jgi:hypothetical protein
LSDKKQKAGIDCVYNLSKKTSEYLIMEWFYAIS